MEKLICSMLNKDNGGYVLSGVEKQSLMVEGVVVDEKEAVAIQENYRKAKNFIEPRNSYESGLDFIPVSPFEDSEEEGKSLSVVRVKVKPSLKRTLYYIVAERKGFHSIYSSYEEK